MDLFLVEYKAREDKVEEVLGLAREFVAGVRSDNDPDVRYRSLRKNDGLSFVHVAEFKDEAAFKRFQSAPHFKKFSEALPGNCEEEPAAQKVEIVADSAGS